MIWNGKRSASGENVQFALRPRRPDADVAGVIVVDVVAGSCPRAAANLAPGGLAVAVDAKAAGGGGVDLGGVNRSVDREFVAGGVGVAVAGIVPLSFHFDVYSVVKTADSTVNVLIPTRYFDIASDIVRAVNL